MAYRKCDGRTVKYILLSSTTILPQNVFAGMGGNGLTSVRIGSKLFVLIQIKTICKKKKK